MRGARLTCRYGVCESAAGAAVGVPVEGKVMSKAQLSRMHRGEAAEALEPA